MRQVTKFLVFFCLGAMNGAVAEAAPISTNTALPVAKGEYVFREQGVLSQSGDDTSGADRDASVALSSTVLGYGVTPELAVFGIMPLVNKRLQLTTASGQRVTRRSRGLGDMRLFARYTIFKQDLPGQTFRVAPLLGIEVPTGDSSKYDSLGRLPAPLQPGSGSWDPFSGVIVTFQTRQFELDFQARYEANTKANDFEFGDVARLDGSLQYRLWPRELAEFTPGFLYGVAEFNLIHRDNNRRNGTSDPDSGGTTLLGLLGLQYVTQRNIIEAGIQLPLYQDLNGAALESGYTVRGSYRVNF